MHYTRVPWSKGSLSPKVKELIYLGISASPTHLNRQAIRCHVRGALAHGATKAELVEVLEVVAMCGIHAITEGVPELKRSSTKDRGRRMTTPCARAVEGVREMDEVNVEDTLAIYSLYSRYARAIDSGDGEAWSMCYSEDGVYSSSTFGECQGRENLRTFAADHYDRWMKKGVQTRHWNGQILLTPSERGSTARSTCCCSA